MKWLKRLLILLGVLLALAGVAYLILCYWVKSEIETRASEALGAEVTISSLWLWPFSEELSLHDVEVTLPPGTPGSFLQKTSLSVERVVVRLDLAKLREKQLEIKGISLEKPDILLALNIQELPPSIGDLARVREMLRRRKSSPKTFSLKIPLEDLEIKEGALSLTLLRPTTKPLSLSLSHLSYEAHALQKLSVSSLLEGSLLAFDLGSGGHVEKKPGELLATGLDLSWLGALFGALDGIKLSGGTLDIRWQNGEAALTVRDLALKSDIPLVSARFKSALSLTIPLGQSLSTRGDPVYLMLELWNGLWMAVVDTLEDSAKRRVMQESARIFQDWYRRRGR